jgi:hypothetical protein
MKLVRSLTHISLLSAIVIMVAAGTIMWLNISYREHVYWPDGHITSSPGWPLVFYDPPSFGSINYVILIIDFIIWLTILFIVNVLIKWISGHSNSGVGERTKPPPHPDPSKQDDHGQ